MKQNMEGIKYGPLYFLSSLGNGGLAVSFFIYLLFMIPHPQKPIPTFEDVVKALGNGSLWSQTLIVLSLAFILYFGFRHLLLLVWNVKRLNAFKMTAAYEQLKKSNAEVALMAVPLTLGMTINVLFVWGALFVPGLWGVVEYVFPFSILAFLAVGIYSIKIFMAYFSRFVLHGSLNFDENNHLSHMLTVFAFTMIGVGFAAPAAMSHTVATSVIAMLFSLFFVSAALVLSLVKMILGFKSILKRGLSKTASPSLWILIPIMTLAGITFVRLYSGASHNLLHSKPSPVLMMFVLAVLVSIQILFGLLGYNVMKRNGYFADYVRGSQSDSGSFSLICPGVAFFVLGMFFLHWGLVQTKVVEQFSWVYFLLLLPFVAIQFKTIQILFILSRKLLQSSVSIAPVQHGERQMQA